MKYDYRNVQSDEEFARWKENPALVPFVFTYDGVRYEGFPFPVVQKDSARVGDKETATYVFRVDDEMQITLVATHYYDYGASEITVWFENAGEKNSKILRDAYYRQYFPCENPVVRSIYGDHQGQYKPYAFKLGEGDKYYDRSEEGRASHFLFPYFNLEYDGGGVMTAIGWSARWTVLFHNEDGATRYVARFATGLRTYLKPKEKIRSPLFLAARYSVRDEFYATNFWRSWFMKYNVPKANAAGDELQPFSTCSLAGDTGLPNCDGSVSENKDAWKPTIDKLFEEKIEFDYRWLDAGWYFDPAKNTRWDRWEHVGSWDIDTVKWGENGFKESIDYAREHGVKTLVWFEPEHVTQIDDLAKNYGYDPKWALHCYEYETPFYDTHCCNNIGDPDCLKWTEERVMKVLKENRVDMFREDFNIYHPVLAWQRADADEGANRMGITECKAVAAHYQFLEDVTSFTASYGGCAFADSCASGGGRNDLQSLRYCVPILRSDADRAAISLRLSMTTSFCKWIPFHGACYLEKAPGKETDQDGFSDEYTWRASYLPVMNILGGRFTKNPDFDFETLRKGLAEWKKVNKYLTKNFYPLTPWNDPKDDTKLAAHCYLDPETETGVLLAYRTAHCKKQKLGLTLPFADAGKEYTLVDEDDGTTYTTVDGKIELRFEKPRTAKLLWVKPNV